jgi:hypothetical protein
MAITFIIKILLVWPYLAEQSETLYFVFFYIAGFLVCLSFSLLIVLIVIRLKRKSLITTTVLHLLGVFLHLLQTVLYLPLISKCVRASSSSLWTHLQLQLRRQKSHHRQLQLLGRQPQHPRLPRPHLPPHHDGVGVCVGGVLVREQLRLYKCLSQGVIDG